MRESLTSPPAASSTPRSFDVVDDFGNVARSGLSLPEARGFCGNASPSCICEPSLTIPADLCLADLHVLAHVPEAQTPGLGWPPFDFDGGAAPAGWSVAEGEPQDAAPAAKRWTVEPGRFLSFDGKRRFRLDLENLTAGEPRYCAPWEGDNMAHVLCMLLNRAAVPFPVSEPLAQEARQDGAR